MSAQWIYFGKRAANGEPESLVIIDTSNFSESEWFELQCVEDEQEAAIAIAKSRNATVIPVTFR